MRPPSSVRPFPTEPHHGNIDWIEEDNERNRQKFGIDFEDIISGFAKPHVRLLLRAPDDFIVLIEVRGVIFETRCRFDMHLIITAARVAKDHAKTTYRQTLSQSD